MKKLIAFALVIATASMAQASYLYWQTGTDATFNGHDIYGYNMIVTDGTTKTVLTSTYTDGDTVAMLEKGGYASGSEYRIDLGDNYTDSKYSFYVEVLGYDSALTGGFGAIAESTEHLSYSQMYSAGYIVPPGLVTVPTAWTGGGMVAPEPTSAMLMLLGMAGLALKRRKA